MQERKSSDDDDTLQPHPSATFVYNVWMLEVTFELLNITRGVCVCVCDLAIYIKKTILRQEEEELCKLNYISPCKNYNLQNNPLK